MKAVAEPSSAVTHIQNNAPAPPAERAATIPTRFPIPTRVAVDTISAWSAGERATFVSGFGLFQQRAQHIRKHSDLQEPRPDSTEDTGRDEQKNQKRQVDGCSARKRQMNPVTPEEIVGFFD